MTQPPPKISLALFCQQFDIDVRPSNAWVLKDLDGECYLEKVLKRFESFGIFKTIYLLVGEGDEYTPYLRFSKDEKVKVVQLRKEDYHYSYRYTCRAWNLYNPSADMDFTPVWLYQIMLGFNEEFLYADSVFNGFIRFEDLKNAVQLAFDSPDHFVGIRGKLGRVGWVFSRTYLREYYFKEKIVGLNRNLSFTPLKNPLRVVENRHKALLNFETIDALMPGLFSKQNFEFMKKFYENVSLKEESKFREEFEHFLAENSEELELWPKVIRICPAQEGQVLDLQTFRLILSQAEDVGRLTIVLDKSWNDHPQREQLIEIPKDYNLHSFLETDGLFSEDLCDSLVEKVDVIQFSLNEINPEMLAARFPGIDSNRIFSNLWTIMQRSAQHECPQVGIECIFSRDDVRNREIIDFWRSRTDYISFFSLSKDPIQGHINPCIQFVKYHHPDVPNRQIDIEMSKREVCVGPDGLYFGQVSPHQKTLREIFQKPLY